MSNAFRKASLYLAVVAAMSLAPVFVAPAARAAGSPTHPFPTHSTYQLGVQPSASPSSRDAAVEAAYNDWKAKFLVTGCGAGQYRVVSPDVSPQATVSEGQGYGMNIVPLMAGYDAKAKAEFDGMWSFVQAHEDQDGLMKWKLDGASNCAYADSGTPDSATDGDLDIGYGLVLADKQWGGYTQAATSWLSRVYAHDVDAAGSFLDLADDVNGTGMNFATRPSDFMLDHLRAFAAYDTGHDWNTVLTKAQSVISQFSNGYSPSTGLLSDFVIHANTTSPAPAPPNYLEGPFDGISSYNSLRVPWRLGTDALEWGPGTVSLTEAQKLSASFSAAAGRNANNVWPTNKLNGTPTNLSGGQCICATAAVGPAAMAAGDQGWTDAIWNFITSNDNAYGDSYYGYTIRLLSEIVMAGDWWNPMGAAPPAGNCTAYPSPSTGTHQVCGAIRDKYRSLGGPAGLLGYPTTDETPTPDGVGRFNHFANNGSIYWTPSTGAWSVHGAIRSKWAAMGWERSVLGYPVTDESGTPDGVGRFNHFANNGSVYWTPSTGAWSVHGAIRNKWAAMGWERSCLAYPVSDEFAISGGRQSNFQRGRIIFIWGTGQATSSC